MALEGTLSDMPFADLFHVFRAGCRSGRLLVSHEEERGLIFVGAGQLLDAVLVSDLEGDSATYAEDAVARILSWREASFVFEHDPAVSQRPRRVERDVAWYLAASARVSHPPLSLGSRLRPALPGLDTAGPLSLSVDEWRLLSALWPQHSIGVACVELELDSHRALPLAQSLVERGLLTLVEEKDLLRPAPRGPQPARQAMTPPSLGHIAHAEPTPKSQLIQAVMRRVRAL